MNYRTLANTATAKVTISHLGGDHDYVVNAVALPSKERVSKRFPVAKRAEAWAAARAIAAAANTPVFDAADAAPAIHAYNDAYVAFIHSAGQRPRSAQSLSALLVAAHAAARRATAVAA